MSGGGGQPLRPLRSSLAVLLLAPVLAFAQQPPTQWSVEGRVVLARAGEDLRPIPGVWVALNRVGDDSAGVVDSVRTAQDGSYRFVFSRGGDPDAMYFTDVSYGGVAYFTDPLRGVNVSGEDAELVVFDTVTAPGMLRLRGRHLVVGPPVAGGDRPIVEVFELTNDTSLTVVPRSDTQPVWRVALPPGAKEPEVGDGDIPASVVEFRDGRAELYAPMAPGLRQLSVRYTLPAAAFPLSVTMAQPAELLEVLLANGATVTGAGLHAEQTVTIEGERYARWLSRSAEAGDRIEVTLSGLAASPLVVPVLAGVVLLVLAAALVHARRTAYSSPRQPIRADGDHGNR